MTQQQRQFLLAVCDCECNSLPVDHIWDRMKVRCNDRGIPVNHDDYGVIFAWARRMKYIGEAPRVMALLHGGQKALDRGRVTMSQE